jgi:hypothetical protein
MLASVRLVRKKVGIRILGGRTQCVCFAPSDSMMMIIIIVAARRDVQLIGRSKSLWVLIFLHKPRSGDRRINIE